MILILLADGFEETEALVPLDLLRRAKLDVKTVGITGKTVTGSHGITVTADILPRSVRGKVDALILPGGMPGAKNLDASPEVDRLIEKTVDDGGRLAAICAAPMILGRRGLLKRKKAVCFPGFESQLDGAKVSDARVVTDGKITTAVGMGAAYEFGLELIALFAGERAADAVKQTSLIPSALRKSKAATTAARPTPAPAAPPCDVPLSGTTVRIGVDAEGKTVTSDVAKFPHALIAGTEGTGKTTFLRSVLCDLIRNTTPKELRMILISEKKGAFADFQKAPHLLVPIIDEPKKAVAALNYAVEEMELRFAMLEAAQVRSIQSYNKRPECELPIPTLIVVVDGFPRLMEFDRDKTEDAVCRIAQKARAVGIHLLIATERVSADVLTGVIKANIPTRIVFRTATARDSRALLDEAGAEKPGGAGEMHYLPVGAWKTARLKGVLADPDALKAAVERAAESFPLDFDKQASEIIAANGEKLAARAEKKAAKSRKTPTDGRRPK